jgi:hypothetical protein
VSHPLREEAAEGGRWTDPRPTVGRDNLVVATKTPHLGGQVKYCFLKVDDISLCLRQRKI